MNFVKQYGKERTGTNVLRALIEHNIPDVCVLMHVLGDKHQTLAPTLLDQSVDWLNDCPKTVWQATLERRAATTDALCASQNSHITNIAPALARAIASRRLWAVISVRDPYRWAYSRCKMLGLVGFPGCATDKFGIGALDLDLIRECESYNFCYTQWLEQDVFHGDRAILVKSEDVATNSLFVLNVIAEKMGVRLSARDVVRNTALPTHWDDSPTRFHFETYKFENVERVQLHAPVMRRLTQIVSKHIDWDLMEKLGYLPAS